jgi:ComF family protein
VLPLPLARGRLAERGFNPAALLARELASSFGLALEPGALQRTRETRPQSGLDHDARVRNVRGAFASAPVVAGRHVALVDDVMTTGATLSAAAEALKRAGARQVDVWALARTLDAGK